MPMPQGGLPGLMPGRGPAHFSVAGNPVRITSQGVGVTVTPCAYPKNPLVSCTRKGIKTILHAPVIRL